MIEGNDQFLRDVSEQIEGKFPGMEQRIEGLLAEGIGRPIIAKIFASEHEPNTGRWKILDEPRLGCLLPTTGENTEHVALLASGDVLITEPRLESISEDYKFQFKPSEDPLVHNSYWGEKSLTRLVAEFSSPGANEKYKVVAQNTNPDDGEHVVNLVKQALTVARETRAKREQVKNDSLSDIFASIDSFLRPSKPKFDLPPDLYDNPTMDSNE